MPRLVIVSNRVPAKREAAEAGGLVVAVKSALVGETAWFGWSGRTVSDPAQCERVETRRSGTVEYKLIDLTHRDIEEYYRGFANRTLWPLLHYRVDLAEMRAGDLVGYQRVNRLFARLVAANLRPDDLVWVHDYHLIPLGAELRRLGIRNRIGFFLHTPWPAADIWSALSAAHPLLMSFDAYDLIGLQTDFDVENFRSALVRFGAPKELHDRVGTYPVSIDTDEFAAVATRSRQHVVARRLAENLSHRKFIIGVDRLDYTKGIGERLRSYQRFLEVTPGARGRGVYIQVTPKSRSDLPRYAELQCEVAQIVGRINAALGDIDWMPIHYLNRGLRREVLAGLYRLAGVGLVTPLRDGMNLVAKEFVAAQDPEDPGVLVLSRFAGAARELGEALLVNPHDIDATAAAIGTAYAMSLDERRDRWRSMFDRLQEKNAAWWCNSFLDALRSRSARVRAIAVEVDRTLRPAATALAAPPRRSTRTAGRA